MKGGDNALPDENGHATLEELATYEPPPGVFDPETVEFPDLSLRLRLRGMQTPMDVDYMRRTAMQWSTSTFRRRLAESIGPEVMGDDKEGRTISESQIWTWALVHTCLVPMPTMDQVARLASRTGMMVERLSVIAMRKSMMTGQTLVSLKNVSLADESASDPTG